MARSLDVERTARARLLGPKDRPWRSAGRDFGNAPAERPGLEPRRPRWIHERLRGGFTHELCIMRTRAVRLDTSLRYISVLNLSYGQSPRHSFSRGHSRSLLPSH